MSKRDIPFQPIRSRLYTSSELSAGFDPARPESMAEMADFLTYRYFKMNGRATPADEFVSMMEALHDNSILQAMFAFLADRRRVAAIMGGHREVRGSTNYRKVAQLAKNLSKNGFLLASGGGPGAMEATHLGALFQGYDDADLNEAIGALAVETELPPNAQSVVDSSGQVDMEIVKALHKWAVPAHTLIRQVKNAGESLAVPTWHYGHEPVTPLASHAAKYFLNSIREDVLLYLSSQGIIFAPGRAGTLQEVFQDAAQNYYPDEGKFFNPMVFFDADGFWTNTVPVKPLLEAIFKLGGPEREEQFRRNVLFTDDIDKIITFLEDKAPTLEQINMRTAQLGMNQMFQATER
jgi:predicted Rossmann-fold nucleotide-binding protein